MSRIASLVFVGVLASSASPAFAQSNSELLGGPGYRAEQEDAARRAAARRQVEDEIAQTRARSKLKTGQAAAPKPAPRQTPKQADSGKTEEAGLSKQAEYLKAREDRLNTREAELDAEEQRLAQLRAEIDSEDEIAETAEAPAETFPWRDDRPVSRLEASIRSCARAGEDKALSRDYLAARYVRAPRFYERSNTYEDRWELRGLMRVDDWDRSRLVDTVCELDEDGRAEYFAFLR